MRTFTMMTAAAALMSCTPAAAGSLADIGLDDPVVTPPSQCRILFGLLPCNEGGHVRLPNDDDDGVAVRGPGIEDDYPDFDDEEDDGYDDEDDEDDGYDDEDDDEDGGQNPGNDKDVGNSPFDGERGEEPSGVDKD